MNPDFTLSVDDIKITQQNALELFYSGIKSPQTKHTMEGNLKYFLLKVCKDILEGDLEVRAQQFVDIARDDQTRAKNIVIAYVKHLVDRTKLDKTEPYYIRPSYLPNKIKQSFDRYQILYTLPMKIQERTLLEIFTCNSHLCRNRNNRFKRVFCSG